MTRAQELWPGRVRAAFVEDLGDDVSVDDGFGPVTVDVPAARWAEALTLARDGLDCTFFDFLTAVDELDHGFRVVCHLADHRPGGVEHLVVRTLVPRDGARLETAAAVFAGARWHERETHEMFGIEFTDAGEALALDPLLLPDEFEGHPLRKDFVLASRVAKPWPGAKEPGESDVEGGHAAAASGRRRIRPPGAPEPDQWGPREPGSEAPDPLAPAAASGPAARPRRAVGGERRARRQTAVPDEGGGAAVDGTGPPSEPASEGRLDAPPSSGGTDG